MKASEIVLELNDVDKLLIAPDSLFYGKRMLACDAEEVIIEEATMAASNKHVHIKVHLHIDEMTRKDEISTAIHQHFTDTHYHKTIAGRRAVSDISGDTDYPGMGCPLATC